ncbi:MAG: hypothetical protein KY475_21800 [Planctomycetes bacterium]|nr:hypothetical protein [Planctomycetota bacterium]
MLKADPEVSQTQSVNLEETLVARGPACENCGATGQDTRSTWCRNCGYYAVLGQCVDLDQDWEAAFKQDGAENESQPETRLSYFAAFRAIPGWIWPLIGVVAGVTALTIGIRLATPDGSYIRIRWAFLQVAVGTVMFLLAQCWACMKAASQDTQFGPWDAVLRPFAIWGPAVAELPKTLRPMMTSLAGATALIAVLTVGGFPYDYLFDGEIVKKPPSRGLVKAIARQAQSGPAGGKSGMGGAISQSAGSDVQSAGDGDVTQSVQEFPGAADEVEAVPSAPKGKPVERLKECDCLIIGFLPSESAEVGFTALLVATAVGDANELRFAATVREGISPELRAELRDRMSQIVRRTPFVECGVPGAVWLEPALTCHVKFVEWTENHFLVDPAFDTLLRKVEAP